MISINLLKREMLYNSAFIPSRYIIVNMTNKGSLRCPLCYPDAEVWECQPNCVHIRRVPIVSFAEKLSQ